MKKISILLIILLQGCGVYECIDMKFARDIKPIDQKFKVDLEFQDHKMSMNIQCEEYYDAMCAERGNYWSFREVGLESQYQTSAFQFSDAKLGEVKIPVPNCRDMVNGRETPLKHIIPKINGESYWLKSSEGNVRILSTAKHKNKEPKIVKVNWSVKINNESLK